MYSKLEEIYNKTGRTIFNCAVAYILDKGVERVSKIKNSEIDEVDGNGLMTKQFCQDIIRTAKEICKSVDGSVEIIQFCDSVSLYETKWYTDGVHQDRQKLEDIVGRLLNRILFDNDLIIPNSIEEAEDDLSDYLDIDVDELRALERG